MDDDGDFGDIFGFLGDCLSCDDCGDCCDDNNARGNGGDLAHGLVSHAATGAMAVGSILTSDLVMGVVLGAMLYHVFGGNRPRFRLNNPKVHNFTPPPVPPPLYGPGDRKAVLVGINYFGTSAKLDGCINDVQRMARRLQGSYQLLVLTDDQSNPQYQPTRASIMNALTWLTSGLVPGGGKTVFFHFSGHGSQQPDEDGEEVDGMDETICPVDYNRAGMISDDDLKRHFLSRIPPRNRLISVMDCCHSGTVLDLPYYAIANGSVSSAVMVGDQMSQKNAIPCDALMLSGCADFQTSADVGSVGSAFVEMTADRRAGGALTSALLIATQRSPAMNLAQLLYSVRDSLRQKGFQQVPQLSASQPYDMHRTIFDLFPEAFTAAQQVAQPYQQPPLPNQPMYPYPMQQQMSTYPQPVGIYPPR